MKVLHVTREVRGDERFGMGRAVHQLVQGLRLSGVGALKFSAGDLSATMLDTAQRRALQWSQRAGGAQQLPLFEILSRAWHTGVEAAERIHLACKDDTYSGVTHVHCHDAVVAHGYLHRAGRRRLRFGVTQHGYATISEVLHHHFMPLPEALRRSLVSLEAGVFARADWVVFLTQLGRANVAAGLGRAPMQMPRWFVVPHAKRPWRMPTRDAARQTLGWRADERILLCVGQFVPLKRMDWVVRAMQGVATPWRLVILGEGDASALFRLAQELEVAPPTITFADDPSWHFAGADAFTSASATEAFPMAHIEALQAGLPVACTAAGGVPELVGNAARLLANDAAAFAADLRDFLADPTERDACATRARQRMASWPDIEDVAARHIEIYRGLPQGQGSNSIIAPLSQLAQG